MAESLALTSFIAYVAIHILRINYLFKHISNVKRNEFLVLLAWALMFFGMGLFFEREAVVTGVAGIDASAKFQMICVLLAIIVLLFVNKPNSLNFITLKPVLFLFGYALIAFATVIVSPAPLITLYKALLLFVDVYLICVTINIYKHNNPSPPLEVCYFIAAIFVAGALLGVIMKPDDALLPSKGAIGVMLKGLYPTMNSNELGFLGALAMILGIRRFFTIEGLSNKVYWGGMIYVGFVVMFLAQARTSLLTALLAIIFMSFVIRKMRWVFLVAVLFLVFSITYTFVSGNVAQWQESAIDTTVEYAQRGQKEGGLQTLKGRADAWQSTGLRMFYDSPIIGHGYDAGVRYNREYGMFGSHMHNSHIQIIANTGALGYLTWIGFVLSISFLVAKLFFKKHYPPINEQSVYFVEICAVLILIVLRTLTGQVMVTHQWSLLIFIGVFIYAYVSKDDGVNDTMNVQKDETSRNIANRILRKKQRRL